MSHGPDLGKLTSEEKDALIEALLAQLEELRSEVAQLQQEAAELKRRLGLDSSNSGKPPSSDGYGKKPRPVNLREKTGRKSGGQEGHEGRNLRQVEHPDHVVEHWPGVCAGCGAGVGRAEGTDHRKRQIFDLPKPQRVEVTEHRAYRCRCPQCGQDTDAAFPASVTAAAQYGPHLAALVVYLQHWHFLPEDRLVELLREVFGVELSAATIAAMGQRKAEEWTELAAHIGEQVKQVPVKHLDETGLRIAGVVQSRLGRFHAKLRRTDSDSCWHQGLHDLLTRRASREEPLSEGEERVENFPGNRAAALSKGLLPFGKRELF